MPKIITSEVKKRIWEHWKCFNNPVTQIAKKFELCENTVHEIITLENRKRCIIKNTRCNFSSSCKGTMSPFIIYKENTDLIFAIKMKCNKCGHSDMYISFNGTEKSDAFKQYNDRFKL